MSNLMLNGEEVKLAPLYAWILANQAKYGSDGKVEIGSLFEGGVCPGALRTTLEALNQDTTLPPYFNMEGWQKVWEAVTCTTPFKASVWSALRVKDGDHIGWLQIEQDIATEIGKAIKKTEETPIRGLREAFLNKDLKTTDFSRLLCVTEKKCAGCGLTQGTYTLGKETFGEKCFVAHVVVMLLGHVSRLEEKKGGQMGRIIKLLDWMEGVTINELMVMVAELKAEA